MLVCPPVDGGAAAQTPDLRDPAIRADAELALANVGLSAVATGVAALARGRSFWKAAARGGLGGLVSFGGKRMIASDPAALGLVGRGVSAVGASITRNAIRGGGMVDTVVVPLGPLRLHLGASGGWSTRVRVDLNSVAWGLYGLANDRYDLDLGLSLRTGALVFYTPEDIHAEGNRGTAARAGAGAVFLSEPYLDDAPHSIHHELTHVAEMDFLQIAFGRPIENALLRRLGADDFSTWDVVEPGIGYYPFVLTLRPLLESEATSLEHR
jgi:hypothetical protein